MRSLCLPLKWMPLIVMQWLSLVIQMMSRYIYLFKVNPAYWIQFDTAMQ